MTPASGDNYHRFNSYKILAHAGRLAEIAAGGMPFPIDWHVYPSNLCNHTCEWCMFRQNGEQANNPVLLPEQLLLRAVDDAIRTDATLMHFSGGGEPLLNRATEAAIAHASSAGLAVALSTNGTYLTPQIASRVDYIRISVNAGSKDEHNRTNHSADLRSDWEGVVNNIRTSVAHKKKDVGLAYVFDHKNWRDIFAFCQLAVDVKVDFVHLRPAFWYDAELSAMTHEIVGKALQECERAKAEFGAKLGIFAGADKFAGYWSERRYDRCRAVLTGTCLTATGDFAVCQDRTDLRFGAMYREGVSFEEVWRSDEHRAVVESIVSPGVLDACPRCVWNNRNELIEYGFVRDTMRMDLV